ncbi:MAG: YggS family pyridoxal phosphate-dependent enzyme [Microbacterium sp.]
MTDLDARLAALDARIADAARAANRDPTTLTRIVVTKFHPARLVAQLHALGVRDVGESRQQELTAKRTELEGADAFPDLTWHFIGQLQTKKARAVRAASGCVHSVDRDRLADALHAADPEASTPLDVFLQVNLTDDPARGGIDPDGVEGLAAHVAAHCPSLRVRGVMGVAPFGAEPGEAFASLSSAAEAVRRIVPDAVWMSAGMSGDFAEAIAAGATHLRIGTAITGPRPDRD